MGLFLRMVYFSGFLNLKDLKGEWFSFVSLRLFLKAITLSRNIVKWIIFI